MENLAYPLFSSHAKDFISMCILESLWRTTIYGKCSILLKSYLVLLFTWFLVKQAGLYQD